MKLEEAKIQFIQTWGTLGSNWGINQTMSQIHALLIISTNPLSTEEIMEALQVSRGNVNMNIRALMEWGLVKKQLIPGERKEFFIAGKDVEVIARQIAKERWKRELEPMVDALQDLENVEGNDKETQEFKSVVGDLKEFTSKVQGMIYKFIRSDKNWFYQTVLKLMK